MCPACLQGTFSICHFGIVLSQTWHSPEQLLDVLIDCSLGWSTKTCFISSLFLVLDKEECLFYLFPRLFHGVSEHYFVYEFGLLRVSYLLRGLDLTQRKDHQTDRNCQTTSRSKGVFTIMPEEEKWTSKPEKIDVNSKELVDRMGSLESRAWYKNWGSQDLFRVSYRLTP